LVIANEKNIPGVVAHILTSSNVVVVSGESVSMVSEAASSGKKVIVFMPALKNVGARHIRFLENLKEKGYIVLCEPADILNALEQVLKGTAPVRRLDDAALVYEAVKKLV
jgi:mitochondrial fission protein ELM1